MNEILLAIIAIFASNGFWTFVQSKSQSRSKTVSAEQKGLLALLHNQLYESCTHYLAVGLITIDEMDNLDCIYEAYHALGGNGTGTRLYERCKALKLKEVADERMELQYAEGERE